MSFMTPKSLLRSGLVKQHEHVNLFCGLYTENPRLKPQVLINLMLHNHPVSNRERGQIKTINLSNLAINLDG